MSIEDTEGGVETSEDTAGYKETGEGLGRLTGGGIEQGDVKPLALAVGSINVIF
ncbi:MAG: hypothetical protein WA125_17610 [Desulfosporosinus sp.]